jgi:hypothetical protein
LSPGTIGLLVNDNLDRFTKAPALQLVLAILLTAAIVLAGIRLIHRYSRISFRLFPLLLLLTIAGQSSDFLLVHFYGRVVSVNIPLTTLLVVLPLTGDGAFVDSRWHRSTRSDADGTSHSLRRNGERGGTCGPDALGDESRIRPFVRTGGTNQIWKAVESLTPKRRSSG